MFRQLSAADRRRTDRPARVRASRPNLEGLEERKLLYATSGGAWALPQRVTFSFMPDGTSIGGIPSNLFATMNAVAPTATWEAAFVKAAAAWEAVTNINLVQVSDSGDPLAVNGNQEGDPRFGDIRIGAFAQLPGQLAFAFAPPPFNGGTDAGDIFFNSTTAWQVNNDYDLQTVAIHEFGHALGMSHSAITQADMYAYYQGQNQSLYADDTAGIQSIYGGTRQPDAFDAYYANTSINKAAYLTPYFNGGLSLEIAGLNLINSSDKRYYSVVVPAGTSGTLTAMAQSSGLSELSPQITIYNGAGLGVAQTSAPNSYGATVTATVPNVQVGQVYYVRVSAASGGAAGVGSFGLGINFGTGTLPTIAPPNTVVAQQPDQGGGTQYLKHAVVGIGADVVWLPVTFSMTSASAAFAAFADGAYRHRLTSNDYTMMHIGTVVGLGDALMVGPHADHHGHRPGGTGRTPQGGHHTMTGRGGHPAAPQHLTVDHVLATWTTSLRS